MRDLRAFHPASYFQMEDFICNQKQVARWASAAGIAILTLSVAPMGFAADRERPYGGSCSTVITPLTPPGVFPQELRIDYDCTLKHLGRTTAIAMQKVTPISQSGVIVTALIDDNEISARHRGIVGLAHAGMERADEVEMHAGRQPFAADDRRR